MNPFHLQAERFQPRFHQARQRVAVGLDREERQSLERAQCFNAGAGGVEVAFGAGTRFRGKYRLGHPGVHAGEGTNGQNAVSCVKYLAEEATHYEQRFAGEPRVEEVRAAFDDLIDRHLFLLAESRSR